MPTTSPALLASAPPELPGCSAASVWMTLSMMRPIRPLDAVNDLPSALTTPALTEPANPSGLPTAITSWPTRTSSASPSMAGCTHDGEVRKAVATYHLEVEFATVAEQDAAAHA